MKMRINKLLDRAQIPDNGGELLLYQRGDEFSIEVAGISGELMSTAIHGSEDALADLALQRLRTPSEAHVVIGGLGMGFTLAAVLRLVGNKGKVIVAELVPEVIKVNEHRIAEYRAWAEAVSVAEYLAARSDAADFPVVSHTKLAAYWSGR